MVQGLGEATMGWEGRFTVRLGSCRHHLPECFYHQNKPPIQGCVRCKLIKKFILIDEWLVPGSTIAFYSLHDLQYSMESDWHFKIRKIHERPWKPEHKCDISCIRWCMLSRTFYYLLFGDVVGSWYSSFKVPVSWNVRLWYSLWRSTTSIRAANVSPELWLGCLFLDREICTTVVIVILRHLKMWSVYIDFRLECFSDHDHIICKRGLEMT